MTPTQRILVIDDDEDICELISATAEGLGIQCITTTDPVVFLATLSPDTTVVILDLLMPAMDGVELLRILGEQRCKASIILLSGVGKRIMETAAELAQAHGLSVAGHLEKPFDVDVLEEILKRQIKAAAAPLPRPRPKTVTDGDLRRAIQRDEFVLFYQPQLDIASGNVVGVEALVRWQHPECGLVFPDDFIPRLEQLGLIDELGWVVTRRGLAEIGLFADSSGNIPMLSINVSVTSLYDLSFPDTMAALIARHGVAPEKVILEITESGLMGELTNTLDVLTRLRMKRMHLSIDDFGTGYAMMQQLRNVPATAMKIDKSFIQTLPGTDRDRVMVRKTIEMGHELGMKVVAEGVETQEQFDFVRSNGCDIAQGYLFSRPLPPDRLLDWLESKRASQFPSG
jgi:EAL domain-containing protein (putative c-di-GMP-specific phosphodiesterase class I)/ActR/RegA family two-component response regulator